MSVDQQMCHIKDFSLISWGEKSPLPKAPSFPAHCHFHLLKAHGPSPLPSTRGWEHKQAWGAGSLVPQHGTLASPLPGGLPSGYYYFSWFLSNLEFKIKAVMITFFASPFIGFCIGVRGVNPVSSI
uniref:Uncharacterized protein n=1 Tax=Pipistrellus kuhlii TaxID=59472 RepID=A0A7J7YM65_PIPKU|nr:hypothetical protein mPipKuh1_010080 [Pipistrellus kuhlii]